MNQNKYVERLEQLATGRSLPECGGWPLSHTTNESERFRKIITASPPVLLSRAALGRTRDQDIDRYVFTYAAPRAKPILNRSGIPVAPPVVMLLKADFGKARR